MARRYRSRATASVHEVAQGLHDAALLDRRAMRRFDKACLTSVRPLAPGEMRALRGREDARSAVSARSPDATLDLAASESAVSRARRGRR